METIKESKTKIYKHFSIGWTGETLTTVKNQTYEISTTKRRGGKISATARKVEAADDGGARIISFSPLADKSIFLCEEKARATEKSVKALHFKALAIFDEKVNTGEVQEEEKQEPQKFDIIFLDGYGKTKGSEENKHVVYEIVNGQFGTQYKTIEADSLKRGIQDHVRPYAEKFGIGMYFEPGYKFKGSEEDLNNMVLDSFEADKKREAQEEAEKKAEAIRVKEAREALIKEFKHLTPLTDNFDDKATKKNLVNDLKHNFPGVKFSVRKRGYNSYDVDWVDGPAYNEVEKVTNNYQSYSSDFTGDYYDHTPSDFNNVFGGFKFLFIRREYSEEVNGWRDFFNEKFDFNHFHNDDYFYRFIQKQSIPGGAKITGIEAKPDFSGSTDEAYLFTFEEEPTPGPAEPIQAGDVEIIEYSEKAIAVIGETKPLKDLLKSLGGRFNFRLSCGAGWIFPKTKAEEVRQALSL